MTKIINFSVNDEYKALLDCAKETLGICTTADFFRMAGKKLIKEVMRSDRQTKE